MKAFGKIVFLSTPVGNFTKNGRALTAAVFVVQCARDTRLLTKRTFDQRRKR